MGVEACPTCGREWDPRDLTVRQREVLALVAEGRSNYQIAQALGISRHTVKAHMTLVMRHLGVESRTQAVTTALRRGIIALGREG